MQNRIREEDKQKFKEFFIELYNKGYSASMIFKELGYDYGEDWSIAQNRMVYYRKKYGLPKRRVGFKPNFSLAYNRQEIESRKRLTRIKQLNNMILTWNKKIENWKKELSNLEKQPQLSNTSNSFVKRNILYS